MSWIPHIMVLDDDPRVLDSLVPAFVQELARATSRRPAIGRALGWDAGGHAMPALKVSAHGYESSRVDGRPPRRGFALHLHLVREVGGRFDVARRLINKYLFGVVVSDLRFSDDAPGLRAGQLFVDEVARLRPESVGLLHSAYPRPDSFPADRFVRKGGDVPLADVVADALERHLAQPPVAAFAAAVAEQGLLYQSDRFAETLTQIYGVARLLPPEGNDADRNRGGRARRPLPCVLIDGESGTGKRGLAAVLRAASDRRKAPLVVTSCHDLTNETLLRSTLFGHKRGAFTDAREDRPGLVLTAGKGVLLLDDFHRLPASCSAIFHTFLEDGEFSRLGEEEQRRQAECAAVLTVESGPWRERRRSGDLPMAFLARVERLPLEVPPLRERPEDIAIQARGFARAMADELHADVELTDEAIEALQVRPFADSNSRELRNLVEQAVIRHHRETDALGPEHLAPPDDPPPPAIARSSPAPALAAAARSTPAPVLNEWQRRLRSLAAKMLARQSSLDPEAAAALVARLFDERMPTLWPSVEDVRGEPPGLPLPLWEDLWRCFAVHWLGGPTPAEKVLGIPANTLRQWINDRESR